MARKVDAEADAASKAILDQLQTKTVGAPPSSTGLTGDQLPETLFDVDDFETVKNQVTLQLSNLELLNVLNTIGQMTNTQSQSGPIPKTGKVVTLTTTSNGYQTFSVAKPGELWQVTGASIKTNDGGTVVLKTGTSETDSVELGQETAANVTFNPSFGAPILLDENLDIAVSINAIVGTIVVVVSCIRVR